VTVNAWAALEKGGALVPWSWETGPLGPHEATVRVLACGLCHSDVHMVDDDWRRARYPLVPGHEVVGQVVEVGGQVRHLKVGDRVGIGWQHSACLQCPDCLRGDENLCDGAEGMIVEHRGGFGEFTRADARFCFPLPHGLATEEAGPLLCGGVTVYSALVAAGMTSGQEIGVIGVGGLGHLAVQFAARLGNRVTVYTTSPDKAGFAASLGASDAIPMDGPTPARRPVRPLDILIGTVPADLDWGAFVEHLGSYGTLTFVGVPPKALSIHAGQLMGRRRRITASPIGGRADMVRMLHLAAVHGIAPIVETFPMEAVNDAIRKVRENTVRYRAVLLP
jgi:alcohol/geraniol dehydrogenase (NADP+)